MRLATLLRARRFIRTVLPWCSLATGLSGALLMERGPKQAIAVALAAVGLWGLLLVLLVVGRAHAKDHEGPRASRRRRRVLVGLQLSSLLAIQNALQFALFFALPFFWRAWAGTLTQLGFLVVLSLAAAASLWDPLTERWLKHPVLAPLLPALASFTALVAVLPGFGLSNTLSLWVAAGATALALPLGFLRASTGALDRRRLFGYCAAGALLPLSFLFGAARVVPPAPLALVKADIGPHRRGLEVADPLEQLSGRPPALVCATAIWAPLGVRERLFHVWRHDGREHDRIALRIRGGREQGFRTWSRKRHLGERAEGEWSCTVETALGQQLGGTDIVIEPRLAGQ